MSEILRQYGKTLATFLMGTILLSMLIGGGIIGVKGLLYIQGDNTNNYFSKAEYQTNEIGEKVTDANGQYVIISDFEYARNEKGEIVTDANGEVVTISHSDDLNNNVKNEIDSFSNFNVVLNNDGTFETGTDINAFFASSNALFTGSIMVNGTAYKLISSAEYNDGQTGVLPATAKINYIKADTIYGRNINQEIREYEIINPATASENADPDDLLRNNDDSGNSVIRNIRDKNNGDVLENQIILSYKKEIMQKTDGKPSGEYAEINFNKPGIYYINITFNISGENSNNFRGTGFTATKTYSVYVK